MVDCYGDHVTIASVLVLSGTPAPHPLAPDTRHGVKLWKNQPPVIILTACLIARLDGAIWPKKER
jgi:hypothetical protein